jgi:hypothetical protein
MKVRARITIAAIATAAAVGTTGAFLLPAASARAVTHTLTFTSVQQAMATFSPTVNAAEDKDVNKAGKVIGYDVLRFSVNPTTNATSIGVAIDLGGGCLYGVMSESSGATTHGTVTGGTGTFKGAAGTITAKALDQTGTRIAVTITYHT